jgi:two-component system response regulator FixJ
MLRLDTLKEPFGEEPFMDLAPSVHPHPRLTFPKDTEAQVIQGRLETLSWREREIADGLVAGKSRRAIASELNLSPRTVEIYRANLMARMGALDLFDLVRMVVLARRVYAGLPS